MILAQHRIEATEAELVQAAHMQFGGVDFEELARNLLLATARSGRADYLVTNDRDLFEPPAAFQRTLPFAIVTPEAFLAEWESK